jgi:hypothetical protein
MPRRIYGLFLLMLLSLPCQGGWQQLFNGTDLTGWSGDPRLWRVEDGVLIGETNDTDKKVSANTFLIWQGGEPGDFELEFKARVTGNNSGVQYRSRALDPAKWVVGGYQLDLHPQASYLGMLYEEKGRGIACERGQQVKLDEKPEVLGTFKIHPVDLAVWNSYRIVAQGTHIRHFVNGKPAAEIEDTNPDKRAVQGIIALQLHAGEAMKVEFKDMRVQQVTKTKPKGEAAAAWIWKSATAANQEKVFFRRQFQLPPDIQSANITLMCDDRHVVFVNGQEIGTNQDWRVSYSYEVLPYLKQGSQNIIAIKGENNKGPAGLLVRFRATLKDGKKLYIVTDHNWLCSSQEADGWTGLNFQETSWQKAVAVRKTGEGPWDLGLAPETDEIIAIETR